MDFGQQRKRRIELLTARFHEALIMPDGGRYLAQTGSFLDSKSFRTGRNKEIFKVILAAAVDEFDAEREAKTRFWSRALIKDALANLIEKHELTLPKLPGFNWKAWLNSQTGVIHMLCKRAQRNQKHVAKKTMDTAETVPMEAGYANLLHPPLQVDGWTEEASTEHPEAAPRTFKLNRFSLRQDLRMTWW